MEGNGLTWRHRASGGSDGRHGSQPSGHRGGRRGRRRYSCSDRALSDCEAEAKAEPTQETGQLHCY